MLTVHSTSLTYMTKKCRCCIFAEHAYHEMNIRRLIGPRRLRKIIVMVLVNTSWVGWLDYTFTLDGNPQPECTFSKPGEYQRRNSDFWLVGYQSTY